MSRRIIISWISICSCSCIISIPIIRGNTWSNTIWIPNINRLAQINFFCFWVSESEFLCAFCSIRCIHTYCTTHSKRTHTIWKSCTPNSKWTASSVSCPATTICSTTSKSTTMMLYDIVATHSWWISWWWWWWWWGISIAIW